VGTLEEVGVSVVEIPFDADVTFGGRFGQCHPRGVGSLAPGQPALDGKPFEVFSCGPGGA